MVHANGHHDFRAKEESTDLYAAVDLVAEKLHKHMARQKDKRVRGRRGGRRTVAAAEFPAGDWRILPENGDHALAPPVTLVRRFTPRHMTTSEAVEEMERKNFSFLVFLNEDVLSILYKRKDKTYGLLEANL